MKIALAHKRLDLKGGTEKDFYRTAQGLRDLGHEIHLFCSEFGVEPPSDVFAHRIPVLPLGRTARLWSLALVGPAIIRKHPCDVVVSFGRMPRADVVRCGDHSLFVAQVVEADVSDDKAQPLVLAEVGWHYGG